MEQLGPVVVARGVEALALLVEPRRLEVGVEDALLAVERAGEVPAVGAEDRAAAAAEQVVAVEAIAQREVVGIRGLARWKWDGATTNARDSRAMCTSVACQASPSSAVDAM